mmetsp:Transcript_23868/g.41061  ORF Transcript_23868/g.41061 Transcript_23868/m.41061 type:complete len:182 (+) Transcript_23868:121-666(+)
MSVYLAGPGIFRKDADQFGAYQKDVCSKHGLLGLYPLDNAFNASPRNSDEARALATRIYLADLNLIDIADGVVADISPFRGPSMDIGTAIEIGYASALKKPIVGYCKDRRTYVNKVLEWDTETTEGPPGVWRDKDGMKVDEFGTLDNPMVDCSCTEIVDTFEEAVQVISRLLGKDGTLAKS